MQSMRFFCSATILLLAGLYQNPSCVGQITLGVFTQQYNNARTGSNNAESILTPNNVNSTQFGKLFSFTVDGQIYAQPLFVPELSFPGMGRHNVVYAVTEMDSVFALDAVNGKQLWTVNFTDPANGIGPVPCGTDGNSEISCGIYPYYGITGTPVIDQSTQTMYLVARTYNNNTGVGYQYLHALDITTGVEKFGGPVLIQGSVPGTGLGSVGGMIKFNPLADIQRPGLLLETNNVTGDKTVYIGWAGASHGWLMAYDASTLEQIIILNTTPNGVRGGVWQSGNGLAADSNGYIYTSTGDGLFDANTGGVDYGDSLLKMDGNLNIVDYFTPMDQACRYVNDLDVSASGPLIFPTQSGKYPDEVVESGKGGDPCDPSGFAPIYLVDRDKMGKFNSGVDNVIEEISGAPIGYWSSPAYWQSATQSAIYYAGRNAPEGTGDYLKMYTLTDGQLSTAPVSQSSNTFPIGATPSTSGNGIANGIVWATERQDGLGLMPGHLPAILYAYDAANVGNTLYNSTQNVARDTGGCGNKFQVPVVANGKVYVGTQNQVDVFGLLTTSVVAAPVPAPLASLSNPCFTFVKQTVGTTSPPKLLVLTNIGNAPMTVGIISIRGLNATDFAQTNACPPTLAPNASCTIKITFTPAATGPRVGQVMIGDNAIGSPHNNALTGIGM
jgi:hypothetical protein